MVQKELKFLADVNIEKPIVMELRRIGYNVTWISELNPYLNDVRILKMASKEERILLTNDKDFGEIVFRQKLISSGIVLFRIKGQNVEEKIKLIKQLLFSEKAKISNHFIVIAKDKFRFVPL